MKRKVLTLILCLCLCVTLLLITALATCPSGIKNNGTWGITIDINSAPYTTYAGKAYGEYAYGPSGCAWFAAARVNQLTGQDVVISSGASWNDGRYSWYGFTRGDPGVNNIRAKSLACYSGHVAVIEAVDGNTVLISEGGSGWSDSNHGYCILRTTTKSDVNSGALGYIYLGPSTPTSKISFDSYSTPSAEVGGINFSVWFSNNNGYTLSAVGFEISVNNGEFKAYTTNQNVAWTRSNLTCNLSSFVTSTASVYQVRAFVTTGGETFRSDTYTINLNSKITFDTYTAPSQEQGQTNFSVWLSNPNGYTMSAMGFEIAANGAAFRTFTVYENKAWTRVNLECNIAKYCNTTAGRYEVRAFVTIGNEVFRSVTCPVTLNSNITFDTYTAPSQAKDQTNFSVWFSNNNGYTMSAMGFEIAYNGGAFQPFTIYENKTWTRVNLECKISDFINDPALEYQVRGFVRIGDEIYRSETVNVIADTQDPVIRNVTVTDVTKDGYTISCIVEDNARIQKVAFPAWTDKNGQDDLFAEWQNTALGTVSNGVASYRVKTSEHNNETNCTYTTHIYVWDIYGNYSSINAGGVLVGTIEVTEISLNIPSISLHPGEKATLTATVLPSNATDPTVTWSTSDPAVATVEKGIVTSVGEGTAIITAKAGDKTATCEVTVKYEYKVGPLTVRDTSGDPLTAIPSGPFLVTVPITKQTGDNDAMVLIASYTASGQYRGLMYIAMKNVPTGGTAEFTFPVDNPDGDVAVLKAFCIPSFGDMTPVGPASVFPTT